MATDTPKWLRRPDTRPGEIARAAMAEFSRKGFSHTTIDDIAAAAGVTKGAVYHHFESKEDVLQAAVSECFEQAFAAVEINLRAAGPISALGRIEAILRAGWNLWCSDKFSGLLHLALFDPGESVPSVRKAFLEQGPYRGWKHIAAEIAAGQGAGEFRPDLDPQATARLITCGLAFQAVLLSRASRAKPREKEKVLESMLEVIAATLSI